MRHIPPYTGAKQLLYDMFNEINHSLFGYRKSWEVLTEVLAHYLGIVQQPWLYSKPSMDIERVKEWTSPLKRTAFQIEWPDKRISTLRALFGLPPEKPRIKYPAKPHHTIYYDHRYKTQLKQYPTKTSKDVALFLQRFQKQGLLEQYVTNARAEARGDRSTIYEGVDHLGAIFEEFELAGRKNRLGQCLTPISIVDFIVKSTVGDSPKQDSTDPITILDT